MSDEPATIAATCPFHGRHPFQRVDAAEWFTCPGFHICYAVIKDEDRGKVTQLQRTHTTVLREKSRPPA